MFGWPLGDAFLIDIGNQEAYQAANLEPGYRPEFPVARADLQSLLSPMHTM